MEVTSNLNIGLFVVSWITTALVQGSCYNYNEQYTAEPLYQNVFTSPNYPLHYDDNTGCSWMIQTNPSFSSEYIVKVTFEEFELEGYSFGFCMDDSLQFYDRLPLKSHPLGSYCGTVSPDVLYSTGPQLYVDFKTDRKNAFLGFKFYYTAVNKEEANGICRPPYSGVESRLSGSSGTFFSPDYPVRYPKGATCIWQITVPEGKVVNLTFEDFALAVRKYDCYGDGLDDYVEIRDSLSLTGKELGRYNCRTHSPQLLQGVYSTGRDIFVKFHSSPERAYRSIDDKGFKASFEAVDPPGTFVNSKELCYPRNANNNNLTLSGSVGTLKSPSSYSTDMSCTWVISVPEGNIVKLSFTKFDMNWNAGKCGDNVEMFDGQYTSSKRLEKYCAYQNPFSKDVLSSGRFMTVRFKSEYRRGDFEGLIEREGFEAEFRAVEESETTSAISTRTKIGVIVGVVVSIVIVGLCLCVVCNAKRKRALNSETHAAMIPMTTKTSPAAHDTQPPSPPPEVPAVNPHSSYPAAEVCYAPVPTAPPLSVYPYPLESPPPYPGVEGAPQYPLPGESYPWLGSDAMVKPTAPKVSP